MELAKAIGVLLKKVGPLLKEHHAEVLLTDFDEIRFPKDGGDVLMFKRRKEYETEETPLVIYVWTHNDKYPKANNGSMRCRSAFNTELLLLAELLIAKKS